MADLAIYDGAKRNDEGDLIKTDENGHETNLTKLFQPGKRKTSNVEMLLIEARQAERSGEVDNPAFPMGEDTADEALARMDEEGLDPAWLQGPSDYRP